jgi:hypothetical protein
MGLATFTSSLSGRTEVYVRHSRGDSPKVVGERHLSRTGPNAVAADGKEFSLWDLTGVYAVPTLYEAEDRRPSSTFRDQHSAMAALHSSIGFDVSTNGRRFRSDCDITGKIRNRIDSRIGSRTEAQSRQAQCLHHGPPAALLRKDSPSVSIRWALCNKLSRMLSARSGVVRVNRSGR